MLINSCAVLTPEGYYNGDHKIKPGYGIIVASITSDKKYGGILKASIELKNMKNNKTVYMEKNFCHISKDTPGTGILAHAILSAKKGLKNDIENSTRCGSLLVRELQSGQYQLKQIRVMSMYNNVSSSSISYRPTQQMIITISNGKIVYIGHIDIDIMRMDRGLRRFLNVALEVDDNFNHDITIFKNKFQLLKNRPVSNNSIIVPKEFFTR